MAMATAMAMAMAMTSSKAGRWRPAGVGSESGRKSMKLVRLSAVLPALLAGPVSSAQWLVVPTLSASETFTDNVRLAPSGSERSDWVTQVTPGVAVTATGPRLRLNASYSPQFLYRLNEGTKDVFQQLNASGTAELAQQLLFVDASASIFQTNVSLFGPQADSNVNNTGNRTNVRTFVISPYLRHAFGTSAQGEARFTYNTVNTDASTSLTNSHSTAANLSLASGPSFKLYTWNLAYSKQYIYYSSDQAIQSPTASIETVSAYGRRLLTPQLAVVSTVGYEDNDYGFAGVSAPKGTFWTAGLQWNPTPRTNLTATTGRRYFGANRALDFSHRTRLTLWSLTYSENVTSTRSQFLIPGSVSTAGYLDTLFLSSFPDPVERQTAVQTFIAQNGLPASLTVPLNFLTNQFFLVKAWRGSFGILGIQNSIIANVFTQTTSSTAVGQIGTGDFSQNDSTKQTGGGLVWTTRISAQTSSNVNVSYSRNEAAGIAREDNLKNINLSLTHQFQPRLSGSLSYRWLQNNSNQAGAGYKENAVVATANMRF